jgi:hypothetical protein
MMAEQKRTVGFNTGERGRFTGGLSGNPPAKSEVPPTLASVGIDKIFAKQAGSCRMIQWTCTTNSKLSTPIPNGVLVGSLI